MSVPTAFFPRQEELNSKMAWGDWSGWLSVPVYADFHDIEYSAIREAAAVIDVSPLYKYEVSGPDAQRLLDRVMTRDMTKLRVDRVFYSPWCDEEGKVLDDGTIARLDDTRYRVTAADASYRWFTMNATGLDVEIDDISDRTAALALQGRLSREVLQEATEADWSDLKYFGRRPTEIEGVAVDVTRTGYTGDRGYELWMPADQALLVWDRLFEVGARYGIYPVGINAMDVARVEAGLILIEAEYTSARHAVAPEQQYSPYRARLRAPRRPRQGHGFHGAPGAARRARDRRPRASPRRPRARLVGHRGHVRQARPGPRDQPVRASRAGARLQGREARSAAPPRSRGARRSRR